MVDTVEGKKVPDTTIRIKSLLKEVFSSLDEVPAHQKEALLRFLEDWRHGCQRKYIRKLVSVPVDYVIGDRAYKGYITNIGAGGAFIEAPEDARIGDTIILTFPLPKLGKPFKTTGEITWKDARSFGVKFKATPYLEQHLDKLIETL